MPSLRHTCFSAVIEIPSLFAASACCMTFQEGRDFFFRIPQAFKNRARPKATFRRLTRIIRLRYSYWRHAMATLSGFQNSLALGSLPVSPTRAPRAPRLFLPPEKFPIAILGSAFSAPLEGTATAILGSTLSAPFDGTRLHWKHRQCSLGKHLESACSYPTRENPYFTGSECSLRKHLELSLLVLLPPETFRYIQCSLGRYRNCYLGKHLECSL